MVGRQGSRPHQGVTDGDLRGLGQTDQFRRGPSCPATGQDERSLGLFELPRDLLCQGRVEGGPLERRSRDDRRVEGLRQDVHRHRHQDRPRPSGLRNVPRAGEDARHLVRASEPPRALDEWGEHAGLIGITQEVELLVRAAILEVCRDIPGDHDQGNRVQGGRRDACGCVRQARSDVQDHDAWLAGSARISVRCVCGHLLVAGGDESRSTASFECGQQADVGVPAQSEREFDLPVPEEGGDVVGHGQGHRCLPVPWDTLAAWERCRRLLHLAKDGL